MALPLLSLFVQTSSLTRTKLGEVGGPRIFFKYLDDEQFGLNMLDTIVIFLEIDTPKVEQIL